ncbi:type II secretion system protein M [Dasania sp. GY-MA-18]|uniref:Type II secretion system protein M n=1 Tax=Dasania phycosphaerae TaxID=2950436 RepID=A0A9J6RNU7_9GAMM|nr:MULTISPECIES: type II secretion system protein M [Dasania]MCR8923245.1 type II secretion system protein M [Dasania sp. GY-MA-18]MCZ0865677.1 type II secretion system protein M [Dasania phycosphaerae]MCZ0869402.1 type II secretion system protein M [Dasania phycosphaerae]
METIKNIQQQLLERFNQLKRKEQYYIVALLLLLVPYVFYMLLWKPVVAENTQLKQANVLAQQQLQTVQQLAQKYKQLSSSGASNNTEVNLPQLIDTSLLRHKLALKRMQPSASGDIQLRFEEVSFNHLVAWLHELETVYGVVVKDASITPGNSDGVVSSSVRLRKG